MSTEKAIELLELMRAPDTPMSRGEVMDLATEILAELERQEPTELSTRIRKYLEQLEPLTWDATYIFGNLLELAADNLDQQAKEIERLKGGKRC